MTGSNIKLKPPENGPPIACSDLGVCLAAVRAGTPDAADYLLEILTVEPDEAGLAGRVSAGRVLCCSAGESMKRDRTKRQRERESLRVKQLITCNILKPKELLKKIAYFCYG